jgi:hypothetical protein
MPVFDLIEGMLMRRLNFPPGLALRLVARSAYVGKMSKLESKLLLLHRKFSVVE